MRRSDAQLLPAGLTVVLCRFCQAPGWVTHPIEHAPGCVILAGGWWAAEPAQGELVPTADEGDPT